MLRGYFYPVKMRLERSADRDKRKIKNISSAEDGQSARGGHLKSLTQKEAAAQMHNGLSIKTYFIRLQTASA